MAAKRCLICSGHFKGRTDAKTCSPRCRKRLQQVRFSLAHNENRRRGRANKIIALILLGLFGLFSIFMSATPQKVQALTPANNLNFQGRLLNAAGAVVPDGNYNIDFKIYNADSVTGTVGTCNVGSNCLWEETYLVASSQGVAVTNGYFSVNLNSLNNNWNNAINWDQQYYLTMNVTTNGTTSCTPRTSCTWNGEMQNATHSIALTSVPLAFRANQLAVAGTNEQILQFASSTFGQATTINLQDPVGATANICYETSGGATAHTCAAATGGSGYIQNSTGGPQSANFNIISSASGSIGGIIHANAGQSVDVFDVNDSGSNVYLGVSSNGSLSVSPATAGTITLGTATQTGAITIGQATTATTQSVNIESANGTASTQTITIGGGTSTTSGGKVVNLATGAAGTGTTNTVHIADTAPTGTGTNAVTIGTNTNASTVSVLGGTGTGTASAGIKLQPASAGDVFIGNTGGTGTIIIGSSTGANPVQIANGSGASAVSIANVQNGGSVSIGAGMTTGTISLGGTATTGTLTLGQYNGASTSIINIGNNAGATSTQQIKIGNSGNGVNTITIGSTSGTSATTIEGSNTGINIGTATTAHTISIATGGTNTQAVTIGSINGSSSVTLQGGTTGTTISLQAGTGGTIAIGSANGNTVNIGGNAANTPVNITSGGTGSITLTSNASTTGTTIKSGTNSTTALQVQNSSSQNVIAVDTVNSTDTSTTNLVNNPSIESAPSASDWVLKGTSTIAQDSTLFYIGANSIKITGAATNDGAFAKLNSTLSAGNVINISFYARSFSNVSNATVVAGYSINASAETVLCTNSVVVTSNGWTKYSCSLVVSGVPTASNAIFIKTTDASGRTINVDGALVQLSATTNTPNYREGVLSLQGSVASSLVLQNTFNSSNALTVQNAGGNTILNVDTTDTNLISNPGFEVSLAGGSGTGWAQMAGPTGTGTITRDTTQSYLGVASLKANITVAGTYGAQLNLNPTVTNTTANGGNYTLSFFARLGSGTAPTFQVTYSPDGTATSTCSPTGTIVTTGWMRLSCSGLTSATSPTTSGYIRIAQTNSNTSSWFIDAVQLEQAASASAYGAGAISLNGVIQSPVVFKNSSDSTSSFQIQNAAGSATLINVDSLNQQVTVGASNTSATSPILKINQASTGDATQQFAQGSNNYYQGIDATDGKFKIGSQAASTAIGFTGIGSADDGGGDTNTVNAERFYSGAGGTVTSMSVYTKALDATNKSVQFAIYADSGGAPTGASLAHSTVLTTMVVGWNSAPISVSLSPATYYWLAFNTNGNGNTFAQENSKGVHNWTNTTYTFAGTWYNTAYSSAGNNTNLYSIYATITQTDTFNNSVMNVDAYGNTAFNSLQPSTSVFSVNNTTSTTTTGPLGLTASTLFNIDSIHSVTSFTTSSVGGQVEIDLNDSAGGVGFYIQTHNGASGSGNDTYIGTDGGTNDRTVHLLSQTSVENTSTTAFQVQNSAATTSILAVDTSGSAVKLGTAGTSGVNGKLVFNTVNASNSNITIVAASTGTSYSLTLPTTGPAVSQCLQSDSVTASQLKFGSCSGAVTTLHSAYNNGSVAGDNIINLASGTGKGGVVINDASSTVGNLFTVQNNAATQNYLNVTSTAVSIADDLNVGTRFGNRLFSDNFESGGFSLWNGGTSGSITADTTTVHNGKYAAKVNEAANFSAAYNDITPNSTVYMRMWVNVTTFGGTQQNYFADVEGSTSGVKLYFDKTTHDLCAWNLTTGASAGCSASAVTTGGWHQVELRTTSGNPTGTIQVSLDGTQVVNATSINNGSGNYLSADIGDVDGLATYNISIDDVSVDTASNGSASSLNVDDSFHVGGTSAFGNSVLFQNSSGSTLMLADSANNRIDIGTLGTETGQLYVSGSIPSAAVATVTTDTGAHTVVVQGHYAYEINYTTGTLQIIDIANPASPSTVYKANPGSALSNPGIIAVYGHYAYIGNQNGSTTMAVVDISNPSTPALVNIVSSDADAHAIQVVGHYMYVGTFTGQSLGVYDVGNPSSPVRISDIKIGANIDSVYVQNGYAYLTDYTNGKLIVYNVSNPYSPIAVNGTGTLISGASGLRGVWVSGKYAYIADYLNGKLQIWDISNPAVPALAGQVSTSATQPLRVIVQGRYAYVSDLSGGKVSVIDISNPASPVLVGNITTNANPGNIAVDGRYLYVPNGYSSGAGTTLQVFDLGGAYIQQLQAGGTETGTLQVDDTALFAGDASIQGGLTVGGGASFQNPVSVSTAGDVTSAFLIGDKKGNTVVNVSAVAIGNLLNDGNFEGTAIPQGSGSTGTAGWSQYNGVETISSSTDAGHFVFGSQSQKVVTTVAASNQGAAYFYQFKPNTTYTFSAYISLAANGGTAYGFAAHVNGADLACSSGNGSSTDVLTFTATITRYTCTFTTGSTIGTLATNFLYIRRDGSDPVARTIYIDGAQLEYGSAATNYADPGFIYNNLILNPSFENSSSGWSTGNTTNNGWSLRSATGAASQSLGTSNDYAEFGQTSMKVVTGTSTAVGNGIQQVQPFTPNTQYSLSFWARANASTGATMQFGNTNNGTDAVCNTVTFTTTWTQFSCTFTTGATIVPTDNIFLKQNDLTTDTIYLDGITLVQAPQPLSYVPTADNIDVDSLLNNITLNAGNTGEIQPWKTSFSTNNTHGAAVTCVLNGYVYILDSSVPEYGKLNPDGPISSWASMAQTPNNKDSASCVAYNGYLYKIGGGNPGVTPIYYARPSASDGSITGWTTSSISLPVGLRFSGAVVANGYLYVVGGNSTGAAVNSVYYAKINVNGSLGAFTTSSNNLNTAVELPGVVAFAGYLWAIGGANGGTGQTIVQCASINADGSTSTWNSCGTLPAGRVPYQAVVINGYAYIVGGGTSTSTTSGTSTVFYAKLNGNGSTGTWQTSAYPLPSGKNFQATVTANGYIYSLNGNTTSGSSVTSVYYTSTSRLLVNSSIDLVGFNATDYVNEFDGSTGSMGGSITAGNITGIGNLQIQGSASIVQGLSVGGALNASGPVYISSTLPTSPVATLFNGTLGTGNGRNVFDVKVQGNYAYTIERTNGYLDVIDIRNPAAPVAVGELQVFGGPYALAVQGRYAYIANAASFKVIDVSNPAAPAQVSTTTETDVEGIYVQGRYAYLAEKTNLQVLVYDISNPKSPTLVSTISTGANSKPVDVTVSGKYLYVANAGNGTLGQSNMQIYNVDNPASPSLVGSTTNNNTFNQLEGIAVQGRYAYLGDNGAGITYIYDVSNPASVVTASAPVGSYAPGISHGPYEPFVQGHYLYTPDYGGQAVQVLDISNPANPALVGNLSTGASSANPTRLFVAGRYVYAAVGNTNGALEIFDLGGEYAQQLEAGGLEAGTISVDNNSFFGGDVSVQGGATFGQSVFLNGSLGVTSAGTGTIPISVNNATTNINLLEVKDLNTNFGSAITGGAFISRNSYFGEEYSNIQTNDCSQTTTSNNVHSRGDYGQTNATCATAGTGEISTSNVLGAAAGGNTCLEQSQSTLNGVERIKATGTVTANNTATCTEYLSGKTNATTNLMFQASNLPVMTAKVTPSTYAAATNALMIVGMGSSGATSTSTKGMPTDGIFFTNCTTYSTTAPTCPAASPTWHGFVVAGSALIGSTQNCTAGADTGNIVQGKTSYLRIEVRNSNTNDIHFFVDTDTSNGIVETECGTGVTTGTTPGTTGLTMWLQSTINTATATSVALDVDYFRVWQDENINSQTSDTSSNDSASNSNDGIADQSVAPVTPDPDQPDPNVDGSFFNFMGATSEDTVINGNLFVHGTIYADKIKANQIEGLSIFSDQLDSLTAQLNAVKAASTTNISGSGSSSSGSSESSDGSNGALTLNIGASGLTVGGDASFQGNVFFYKLVTFVQKTVFNEDVSFNGHITTGGAAPTINLESAAGLSVDPQDGQSHNLAQKSISGNDNSGKLSVTIGDSATAGEVFNVSFNKQFSDSPNVFLTATNQTAAGLRYYVTTTNDGFKIAILDTPISGTVLNFNYLVIQ